MPIKYIGRKTDFRGKSLWEIVGNLKNFGIGRYVVRSRFERYPEPSFMKIVKVETLPNPLEPSLDNMRKVKVWVEKTFRGQKLDKPVVIESTSYKTDYRLVPKDEESKLLQSQVKPVEKKILPRTVEFPPLMKELLYRDASLKGEKLTEEPRLFVVYGKGRESHYRVADEGETPTVKFGSGLGEPASPNLYKGI